RMADKTNLNGVDSQNDMDYNKLERKNQQLGREVNYLFEQLETLKIQFAEAMIDKADKSSKSDKSTKSEKKCNKSEKKLRKRKHSSSDDDFVHDKLNESSDSSSSSDSSDSNQTSSSKNSKDIQNFAKKIKFPEYVEEVGTGEQVKTWLSSLERYFELQKTNKLSITQIASYQLKNVALNWWEDTL
ncbi:hypothetical protein KI387_042233, partial [Taxus chinensis]